MTLDYKKQVMFKIEISRIHRAVNLRAYGSNPVCVAAFPQSPSHWHYITANSKYMYNKCDKSVWQEYTSTESLQGHTENTKIN